eukprot:XP_003724322.1 PREDICTED: uncharacterized protein LOC580904 isoform X2 [Strongylocentrotus purpuratus]
MPLSIPLLRRRCRGPLNEVKYVDLANRGLAKIENLNVLPKLETLILKGNDISLVQNLMVCHHLWHLHLGNNQVTNLDGLSKFVALGTLNLSLNNLSWSDLRHIRHMYILELSLHGNPKLDRDPYYRLHVIDCLPNVWMLDGRLITSAERIQVEHFFQDTSVSDHPVRHKLPKEQFVPTSQKKIQVHGIYGHKTTHFMMKFPTNGDLNVGTDLRRLAYMAYNIQEDILTECQQTQSRNPGLTCKNFVEQLLEIRSADREKCNILLILLVASLEFTIPHSLLQDALTVTNLRDIIDDFDSLDLLLMTQNHQCRVLSLLLSAVKVDRDDHQDGGLYEKLYLCLYYTVAEIIKHHDVGSKKSEGSVDRTNPIYREYRSLLAAEVVQLLCIVPSFYIYLTKDPSISQLVTQATGKASTMDGVEALMERIRNTGGQGGSHRIIEEVSEYLMDSIQRNTKKVMHKKISSKSTSKFVLETTRALPKRPQSSPVFASQFLAVGQPSPVGKPYSRPTSSRPSLKLTHRPTTASSVRSSATKIPSATALKPRAASARVCRYPKQQEEWRPAKPPRLGDKVLLGPQSLAYIIALPEYDVALLQMEAIPDLSKTWKAPNGSVVSFSRNTDEHYAYMNMVHMEWDSRYKYWKPRGTVGDRITLQSVESMSEIKPPPSSPTSSISPRSLDGTGTECTPHPSPRELNESLPIPISLRFREKLQLSPEKIIPIVEEREAEEPHERASSVQEETSQEIEDDIINRREIEAVEQHAGDHEVGRRKEDALMEQHESHSDKKQVEQETTLTEILSARMTEDKKISHHDDQHPHHSLDDSLYNCLRCAMETIQINTDVSAPSTARDERSQTERERNGSMVSQVAEANTASTEDLDISDALHRAPSRPNTAKSAPDSYRSQAEVNVLDLKVWPDPGDYTEYQRERTKVWGNSLKRPNSSSVRTKERSTPRASSAKSRSGTPTQPVLIQMGNHWMAGGRDIATWERVSNRMKTFHAPGWIEGSPASRRPKSVGPYKYKPRGALMQRRSKSAVGPREKPHYYQDSSHPPPSPASTDFTHAEIEHDPDPSYLHQAHQHNFPSSSSSRPTSGVRRPTTPPFGGPKKPPSPLHMTIKFL